jgi:hypothetical protein
MPGERENASHDADAVRQAAAALASCQPDELSRASDKMYALLKMHALRLDHPGSSPRHAELARGQGTSHAKPSGRVRLRLGCHDHIVNSMHHSCADKVAAASLDAGLQRLKPAVVHCDQAAMPTCSHVMQVLSEVRWNQPFSVAATQMNDAIHQQYIARERDARLLIMRFMEANDQHLPAIAVCSGVSYYPDTKKLAAFTSDRFFRGLAASSRCPMSSGEDSGVCVPPSEAAATELLFRVIESEASCSLTLVQMAELAAISKFYMADPVIEALPQYFEAAMQQMNANEVRA